MMNSPCDCKSYSEADHICICYDSEEEANCGSEDILYENIHEDGKGTGSANDGFAEDTFPSVQSCHCTETEENFDSITDGFEVLNLNDGELGNKNLGGRVPGTADFGNVKLANEEDNGKPLNGKIWYGETVELFPKKSSVTFSSAKASAPNAQKRTLESNCTLDPCKPLNGDSTRDKKLLDMMEKDSGTAESHSTKYEWQFQENDGNWVSYDSISATDLKSPQIKNLTISQGIDKYCKDNPEPAPMVFIRNNHRCVLNLQAMTEHDRDEGIRRSIRRVTKPTLKSDETTVTEYSGSELIRLTDEDLALLDGTPNSNRNHISSISKWRV